MIKKITLLILSIILISPAVSASTTANVKVSGEIKMPTCLINGNEQSDFIFELINISTNQLHKTSYMTFSSPRKNKLTVTCDAETYLAYSATDTYENTPWNTLDTAQRFSMVLSDDTDKSIGAVMFTVSDVTIDSKEAVISTRGYGGNYSKYLPKSVLNSFSTEYSSDLSNKFTSGQVFSVSFSTDTFYIGSTDELTDTGIDLASSVDYQAEAVLAFNFGI